MARLFIDYTNGVLSTHKVLYHGGGDFSRFILGEISRSEKFAQCNCSIKIIWPLLMGDEITDEERKIKDRYDIIERNNVLEIEYLEQDILFFPLIDCYRFNIIGKVKKKFPFLKIYCVLHGLRLLDVEKCDKYDRYYYRGIKRNLLFLQIRRLGAAFLAKVYLKKYLPIIDRCYTVSNNSMQKINNYGKTNYIKYFTRPVTEVKRDNINELKTIDERYLLFVSANRYEKNLIRSLIAFSNYKKTSKSNLKFYAVGVTKEFEQNLYKVRKLNFRALKEEVHFWGYIESEKLRYLYRNCEFLLYVSKSEGYGLPPLEAMQEGRPTVAASTTSVPEVLGMAAYYVNPYSTKQIEDGIAYMDNEGHQLDYIARMNVLYDALNERGKQDINILVKEILDSL